MYLLTIGVYNKMVFLQLSPSSIESLVTIIVIRLVLFIHMWNSWG